VTPEVRELYEALIKPSNEAFMEIWTSVTEKLP
jgi:hypothetical protein